MKILLTAASSFTGYWFASKLVEAGHSVVATFTKNNLDAYSGAYRERVERLLPSVASAWAIPVGSDAFIEYLENGNFDLLCLHGAQVGDHRSPAFPVFDAVSKILRSI